MSRISRHTSQTISCQSQLAGRRSFSWFTTKRLSQHISGIFQCLCNLFASGALGDSLNSDLKIKEKFIFYSYNYFCQQIWKCCTAKKKRGGKQLKHWTHNYTYNYNQWLLISTVCLTCSCHSSWICWSRFSASVCASYDRCKNSTFHYFSRFLWIYNCLF